MRKIYALLALVASLFVTPAFADWTGKDASLATVTFKNPGACTSVVCTPIAAIFDPTGVNGAAVPTAGADAQSNTANGLLTYARNLVFNGTTWDRWTGAVTNAGTFAVQLTGATNNINNIAGTVSLPTGASTSANQTSQITQETATAAGIGTTADAACGTDNGTCTAIALIKRGNQNLTTVNTTAGNPIAAGTNPIGTVAIAPTAASGGWTHWSTPSDNSNTALTTTVVAVKSSAAGKFGGYYISNTNATVACLQVFDVATAGGVTLGTTRPNMVYCIPATSAANMELVNGALMANGIQIAATTTASGSSALGAGLDVTVYFK